MTARQRLESKAQEQGPCFLCGPRNLARHRLWDSIDCSIRVDGLDGWDVLQIAKRYGVSEQEVRDVREAFREARRLHKPLPGRMEPPA